MKSIPRLALAAALLFLSSTASGVSTCLAGSLEDLYPCFRELGGWNAQRPMNASVEMGEMKMLNVTRVYEDGDRELTVMLTSGAMAQASWAAHGEGTRIETPDASIHITRLNGYTVQVIEDKREHSSTLTVLLNQGSPGGQDGWAVLTFAGNGLSRQELLDLSRSFDWDCFKAKIKSVR